MTYVARQQQFRCLKLHAQLMKHELSKLLLPPARGQLLSDKYLHCLMTILNNNTKW